MNFNKRFGFEITREGEYYPLDTRCLLNVHQKFRRSPGRVLNVLHTIYVLRPCVQGVIDPFPPYMKGKVCIATKFKSKYFSLRS